MQIKSITFLLSHLRLVVIRVDNKNYNFRCVRECNHFALKTMVWAIKTIFPGNRGKDVSPRR